MTLRIRATILFAIIGLMGILAAGTAITACDGAATDDSTVTRTEPLRGGAPQRICDAIGLCVEGWSWDFTSCSCLPDHPEQGGCDFIGLCLAGTHWSDTACACLPDGGPGARCGDRHCGANEYCCNASCGICAPIGGGCIQIACSKIEHGGKPCGPNRCAPGEECCNESCGICTPKGGVCTQQVCEPVLGIACGPNMCPTDEVCCNASCGICTPPDGFCTQQACEPI